MKTFAYYESDGRIIRAMTLPDNSGEANIQAGQQMLDVTGVAGFSLNDYYVNGSEELVARVEMPALVYPLTAVPNEIVEISNIPSNCLLSWPDSVQTRETGTLSFESAVTGTFVFFFDHPHYYQVRIAIDVA